jgi:hypothetical protein
MSGCLSGCYIAHEGVITEVSMWRGLPAPMHDHEPRPRTGACLKQLRCWLFDRQLQPIPPLFPRR